MYIALDSDFKRVHIDECITKGKYFCPYCKNPLDIRRGDIRRHHFAHKKSSQCSDTWAADRSINDNSDWHNEWQNRFPVDNQEIRLVLGKIIHRADVMVRRTVFEFQHSPLNREKFSHRNTFYSELGHKVVWIFDYQDIHSQGEFTLSSSSNGETTVIWKRPKHTFDNFTNAVRSDGVELYFQITDETLLRITSVSEEGFENFKARTITVDDFLNSFRDLDGSFPKAEPEDLSQNPEYLAFKEKYNIMLNPQQERAVQTISGANLLLAVPGSGKTTVLISRIGFMVLCRHIAPQNILAVTYTKKAADEMRERTIRTFGYDVNGVSFKTINSFADEVLRYYERSAHTTQKKFDIIEEKEKNIILRNLYRKINPNEEYPNEEQIKQLSVEITRKKNGVDLNEMKPATLNFDSIYKEYSAYLDDQCKMDYDDQISYAIAVLRRYSDILHHFRDKYRYICVDEAQDTSKSQHLLIHTVSGDNIFMVGDEDQSIYSFRGAFPRALTDFENKYNNPYILRMETNYRSYSEITETANRFISRNTMRHEKSMLASRGKGGKTELLTFKSRESEYEQIYAKFCQNADESTAILYHDSDCGICLIAMLLENQKPFRLLQNATTFFTNRFVKDTADFIHLALDPYNSKAFMSIYYKIDGVKYNKGQAEKIAQNMKNEHKTIFDAIRGDYKGDKFTEHIQNIAKLADNPISAIGYIAEITNRSYNRAYTTLRILAQHIYNISELDGYLAQLKIQIDNAVYSDTKENITLSTIHSAKGMEYKNVVILDVNDRIIPKVSPTDIEENEDKKDLYQEERRLFYVAMTRARDNLYIAYVESQSSTFVDEVFGHTFKTGSNDRNRDECLSKKAVLPHNDVSKSKVISKDKIDSPKIQNSERENEEQRITDIYNKTGRFVTMKKRGEYQTESLDEIIGRISLRQNHLNVYNEESFKGNIREIQKGQASGVSKLCLKIHFITSAELTILHKILDELKNTDTKTFDVIEQIMKRVSVK